MVNYSDVPRPESVLYFEQNLRRHSNIVYYEKMEDFVYKLVLGMVIYI